MNYLVHFDFGTRTGVVTEAPSIADVKDGFWVNSNLEFTNGSDCKFWIPPSRIIFVVKA